MKTYLKFQNPIFREDGLNTTIREDIEEYPLNEPIEMQDVDGNKIGEIEIIWIFTKKFEDLDEIDMEWEHDSSCRSYESLLENMRNYFPDFREDKMVQVIYFIEKKIEL